MEIGDFNLTLLDVSLTYNDSYNNIDLDNSWLSHPDLVEILKDHYLRVTNLQKTSITLFSIIFVLGIIGNGLVIWIAGFRMKKTISAMWFLNLAIADFLCCASLPLRIADWAYYLSSSKFIFCKLGMIMFNLNMSASVFILTAMSIDRCVSVMWPFWAKVHRTCKLVRITTAIIWVLSLILTGLVFVLYAVYLHNYSEWCSSGPWLNHELFYKISQIAVLVRLIIMFVIPFLIISISFASIFLKLRKSKIPQRSHKPYRILTAVILCFFICWSPYYIWPLTPMYGGDSIGFHTANNIIINLAYLNSCINPIIFVFMGQNITHSFLRSIPFRLERAFSDHLNDHCEEQEDHGPARTIAV